MIDCDGISPSIEHIQAVCEFPMPSDVHKLQRFLGLASYFRRFVCDFAKKASPLYALLKKGVEFNFNDDAYNAFVLLKESLSEKPILSIYSPELPTELHTDASSHGFGAILLQKQEDGRWHPVFYYSRRTSDAESRYTSYELEFLAIVYAIRRFHVYLHGVSFTIVTDCNAVKYTFAKIDIKPRVARWVAELQNYDYKIEYRSGNRMAHVDALSRVHEVLVIEDNDLYRNLSICQQRDDELKTLRSELEESESPRYELREGLVYRKKDEKLLFYVPQEMINSVIKASHDDMGHMGLEKTLELISQYYWFPKLKSRVKSYIENCLRCIAFNVKSRKIEGELHSIDKGCFPYDTVHVDHVGPFEKSKSGFRHMLVIVDSFSKFCRLYATKSTGVEEVIRCLDDCFVCYSYPRRIVSDRGTCFISEKFASYVNEHGCQHILIATSTPNANGQVEKCNSTILKVLSKAVADHTSDDNNVEWVEVVNKVQFAINNCQNSSTKFPPSVLLFGRRQFGGDGELIPIIEDCFECFDLATVREQAVTNNEKASEAYSRSYDKRSTEAKVYYPGDYVMIKNIDTSVGSKKLIPKFKGPYVVKGAIGNDRYCIIDVPGFQLTQKPYEGVAAAVNMKLWRPMSEDSHDVRSGRL